MAKVFTSSLIRGMEEMRAAVQAACEGLDLECLRAEDLPASPSSPQGACLQLVRESDAVVLLLGERYGAKQPSGKSATEEEFDEAVRLGRSVFVFRLATAFDADQEAFAKRVGNWQGGQLHKTCATPMDLQREVTRALRTWTTAPPEGDVDEAVKRNLALVVPPSMRNSFSTTGPWIAVSWVPSQRLHLDEDFVFHELPTTLGDLFVTGDHRLSEVRPRLAEKQEALEFTVGEVNRGKTLMVRVGLDAAVAIGVEIRSRGSEPRGYLDSLVLRPRDLAREIECCVEFVRGVIDSMDSQRAVTSGRLQTNLSRMDMKRLGEPPNQGTAFAIPMRGLGDRDGAIIVPKEPETIVRPRLAAARELATRYVTRFQRAHDEDQSAPGW